MKKFAALLITIIIILSSISTAQAQDNPNFYLHENGVTIMCPEATVGEIGTVNGIEYEAVDRALLIQRRDQGADLTRVCTSLVTDMSEMFSGDYDFSNSFNQPIGKWDVSNVTNMYRMFYKSHFNQPIANWNTSNVTDMKEMFYLSSFNQPIGSWDVGNVTLMRGMFYLSPFNQPIGDWDVSNVTDMSLMFNNTPFNQPIGNWDVSSVTLIFQMFNYSAFNQPIGEWDVSSVTQMGSMFSNSPFNQPIGDWDVSSVVYMRSMFSRSSFNQPIGDWDVSNVFDMGWLFTQSDFNQNLSGWCVALIDQEPPHFSTGSPLAEDNKPIWGTCGETNLPFGEHPSQTSLSQNYPNPFNPVTQIRYELPEPAEVRLEVFNLMGQRVATLVSGEQQAGVHIASFNAANYASGVYVYRLSTGNFVETRKMVLVK